MHLRSALIVSAVCAALSGQAHAVIKYGTSWRNKEAPSGALANSGWQWEGKWGAFTATPIAKNYFITAGHVGGGVGQALTLGGKSYTTVATYDDPNSDLQIWKTSQAFTSWAPLNNSTAETGKSLVVFGRGTARGTDIRVNGQLKGWNWAQQDGVMSWGTNTVAGALNTTGGSFLKFSFDKSGGTNEGIMSAGDSGGAVFINNGGWKLAGINYSVDGPFATSAGAATFLGAVFDTGGLYQNGGLIADATADKPASSYASRISTNLSWINSVLGGRGGVGSAGSVVPEPTTGVLLVTLAALASRGRRRL